MRLVLLDQRVFTLVGILVSLAIPAMLFGIFSLKLDGVGRSAEVTIDEIELGNVLRALEVHITRSGLATIARLAKNLALKASS